MDQQTLLYIMTAFVIIAAVSLVLQLATLFGLYRVAKQMQEKTTDLLPKVHSLVDTSQKAVAESKQQIMEIAAKTNALLDTSKVQMAKVDTLLTDATGRAKVQLERAEMVIDDTMSRAHETVAMVHGGIMRPLREIHGIAAGIKTAVSHLAKGTRPSVAQATHDEEMFI